jgi:hypothetical protein
MFSTSKDYTMKLLIALALLAILTGCNSITDLGAVTNPYTSGSVCSNYQVQILADTIEMTPSDSTKICPDGNAPVLYKVTFITREDDCDPTSEKQIVGGMKGVHRQFGCWKPRTTTWREPI